MKGLSSAGENRLPGIRKLCGELDVSFVTVNKVIKRLTLEGRIQSIPKKGNYIIPGPHPHNIGLILGDENDSSFLHSPPVMEGLLHVLGKGNCSIRLIQAPAERVATVVDENMLDAAIWYLPVAKLMPKVNEIITAMDVPVLPVLQGGSEFEASELPACHVAPDLYWCGQQRVEFLLKRGHRKIARFNIAPYPEVDYDTETFRGFQAAIDAYGGQHELSSWSVSASEIDEKIPRILDEGEVTAATVNGGATEIRNVFETMSRHVNGTSVELVIADVGPALEALMLEFPKVRVVGITRGGNYNLGVRAAEMLLDHLDKGVPLAAVKVAGENQAL
jgi:DNA-binding LacI/PurR family transcriptional regulator